jgi:hypothetical protein
MMSCSALAAWSRPVLSLCCIEPCSSCGAVLLGHNTTIAMLRSGQLGRRCTVAACTSVGTSVMHERALETREPSCVPKEAKPFINPMVHSPSRAVGHMAAPEFPSQQDRAPSRGTRGRTRAPLSGRQSLEPWDTWRL